MSTGMCCSRPSNRWQVVISVLVYDFGFRPMHTYLSSQHIDHHYSESGTYNGKYAFKEWSLASC